MGLCIPTFGGDAQRLLYSISLPYFPVYCLFPIKAAAPVLTYWYCSVMSGLRVLVGCKRVIDYAVKVSESISLLK